MFESPRFVGRQAERRLVQGRLTTRHAAPFVVHVQGMPGVGKSALLEQLAADARQLGFTVHAVARSLPSGERSREVAKRLVSARRQTLVVVDDWDELALAEPQLIDRLERAAGNLVLLVGSQARPRPPFLESALFPDRFHVLELGGLPEDDALELLRHYGKSPADGAKIHRACDGQPFAMLVMATSTGRAEPTSLGGRGSAAFDYMTWLLGRTPDPHRAAALELLSLVGSLNERELRLGLGIDAATARAVFEWLRHLTIVRPSATGLAIHELVRVSIVTDLLQRDPVQAQSFVARVIGVVEESLAWSGIPRNRALDQLRTLIAGAPQDAALARMFDPDCMRVTQAREREFAGALALIEALEGPAARAIAERMVGHDPDSLTVVRDGAALEAVMVRVEWRGLEVPPAFADPLTLRLAELLRASGELTAKKLIRVSRFFLARAHGHMPCAELGALGAVMTRRTLETQEPFVSVQVLDVQAVDAWRDIIRMFGFRVRDEAATTVGGRVLVPCVADLLDLGAVFLGVARRSWGLDGRPAAPIEAVSAARSAAAAPTQEELEAEIMRALGHLRDVMWLRGSELGGWLFPGEADRGEALQKWLLAEIAATESMRHGELVARALRASFDATRSLDEAAAVARMGVSTLKRYRKLGIVRLAEVARGRLGQG